MKTITTIFAALLAVIGGLGAVFLTPTLSGTVLWAIWPVATQAVPGLVANGTIAQNPTWWTSVCLSWVFAILVKSTQTNNNENKGK